jgi:hypothetical protein
MGLRLGLGKQAAHYGFRGQGSNGTCACAGGCCRAGQHARRGSLGARAPAAGRSAGRRPTSCGYASNGHRAARPQVPAARRIVHKSRLSAVTNHPWHVTTPSAPPSNEACGIHAASEPEPKMCGARRRQAAPPATVLGCREAGGSRVRAAHRRPKTRQDAPLAALLAAAAPGPRTGRHRRTAARRQARPGPARSHKSSSAGGLGRLARRRSRGPQRR